MIFEPKEYGYDLRRELIKCYRQAHKSGSLIKEVDKVEIKMTKTQLKSFNECMASLTSFGKRKLFGNETTVTEIS